MFVFKEFAEDDLDRFFDIFKEIGITEIEAEYSAQGDIEEFDYYCWNQDNEDVIMHDDLLKNQSHKVFINSKCEKGLNAFLGRFLKSCIPIDYKEKFGSFGFIKFKIEERDYEIIKFEYPNIL